MSAGCPTTPAPLRQASPGAPSSDTLLADRLWADFAQATDARSREVARRQIIRQFTRLAYSIANRFARREVFGGDHEDLCQVAMIGLVKAVDRFDPGTGYRFTTFAAPTILGEIRRYLRDHSWSLHVPRGLQELLPQVYRATEELREKLDHPPTAAEIAEHLNIREREVQRALDLDASNRPLSLDAVVDGGGCDRPAVLEQCLGAPDQSLSAAESRVSLEQALRLLPPDLQEIIHLRFFAELSQREVAIRLGLSQMGVCRLERKALERLRSQFRVH